MNNLIVTGNLGKDPKLTFSKDGKAIASFSLAVSQRVKKDNEWVDGKPMWLQTKFFGGMAEKIADRYAVGDTVTVSGRLEQSWYTDKDTGEEKFSLDLICFDILKVERTKKDDAPASTGSAPF
jgi:single-strand DNA-binding protein